MKKFTFNNYRIKGFLLILPIFIFVGVLVLLGIRQSNKGQTKTYRLEQPVTKQVLGVSVSSGLVDININSKTLRASRLTINIQIKNNSINILQFSPGLNLKLVDSEGIEYLPTMKFVDPAVVLGGPINSGQRLTLDIDFEVPETTSLEKLVYQQDQVSEKLEIKL